MSIYCVAKLYNHILHDKLDKAPVRTPGGGGGVSREYVLRVPSVS